MNSVNQVLALELLLTKNSEPTIWLWLNQLAGNMFPGQFWERKMLNDEQIEAVKVEMRRMARMLGILEKNKKRMREANDLEALRIAVETAPPVRNRHEAAVRRASMDLTRALADLRRRP